MLLTDYCPMNYMPSEPRTISDADLQDKNFIGPSAEVIAT